MTVRTPPTASLALVAAAGPFSTDAYVSALPAMQSSLHISAATAQLTATTCIIGLAVGMSLSGPISDAKGRRVFLLGGAVAYLLCSVLCALAPNAAVLVAGRLVQGLAAGCAAPVGRAVITDRFSPDEAARRIATLTSVALLAPVIAPAVGGALLTIASWRAVFWFMAAVGAAMVLAVLATVPESLPAERRQPGGLRDYERRIGDLLTDRSYLAPLLIQCLAVAGLFVYVGGSPFVLQHGLGVSPELYSVMFATDAIAMVLASVGFRLAVTRHEPRRLRAIGSATSAASGTALLVAAATAGQATPLAVVWVLLAITLAGMGLTVPAASVLAQEAGGRSAGTAASLFNGVGYLVAALAAPLTGIIDGDNLLVMAALMAGFFMLSAVTAQDRNATPTSPDPAGRRRPSSTARGSGPCSLSPR